VKHQLRPAEQAFFKLNPQLRITPLGIENNIKKIKNQKLNIKNTM